MGTKKQLTSNQVRYDEECRLKEIEVCERMTVAKRNDLIQQMRFDLSRTEQLCVLYAIAQIKPTDDIYTEYELDILQLQKLIGIENEKHHTYFKQILKNIRDKSAWVKSYDKKTETVISWFSSVTIERGTGKVKIKFHEKLQPYLIDLHKQYTENGLYYTTYNLLMVLRMKSKYGIRLYELIKSHSNELRWSFDIEEIKELMGAYDKNGSLIIPKKWSDFNHFKTKVIEPAIEDIKNYSDLHIEYDTASKGRKVVQVTFYITPKSENEMREILSAAAPYTFEKIDFETILQLFYSSKETIFRNEHPLPRKEPQDEW